MCCAAAVLSAGCGSTSDRLRIRGEVRLDGEPIDQGSIRFMPTDSGQALSAGTMIQDGGFDIPQDQGLPPGTYRVSISSPDLDGEKVPYSPGPGMPSILVTRNRIPASYNMESQHTIELEASGANYFEFDIPSSE